MSPIEGFLSTFTTQLPPGRRRRSRIAHEVEDHLRTLADELEAAGRNREEAEREAVARFGSSSEVAGIVRSFHDDRADALLGRAWRALVVVATVAAAALVVVRSLPDESLATVVLKLALVGVMAIAGGLAVLRPHAMVTGAGAAGLAGVGLVVVLSYEMSMTAVWPGFGDCFRTIGGLLVLQGGLCGLGTSLRPARA